MSDKYKNVILPKDAENLSKMYSYEFFESHKSNVNSYNLLSEHIRNEHPKLNTIVDIGCGHGLFVE